MTRPGSSRSVSLLSPQARSILTRQLHLTGTTTTTLDHDNDVTSGVIVSRQTVDESRVCVECNTCHVTFDLRTEQVAHYRLDWHRYNLKRRLKGLPHVTQEIFEEEAGDLSSISGSDAETSDEETEQATPTNSTQQSINSPFVYFTSGDDRTVYSVYRTILTGSKDYGSTSTLLPSLLSLSTTLPLWVILMHSGGHFAGAVFNGANVVVHKTFHRYTVRAKRGTSQSARDSQSGGHGPRSAGASLRRYNEGALEQEVHELIKSWSHHLKGANAIFIRTPKTHQSMFTGGRQPQFTKDDPRVRGIPFVTRRPTLKEVKRVYNCLASIYIGNSPTKTVDTEMVTMATVAKVITETELTRTSSLTGVSISEEENKVRDDSVSDHKEQVEDDCGESDDGGDDKDKVRGDVGDSGVDGEGGDDGTRNKRKKKKKKKAWTELVLSPAVSQLLSMCVSGGNEEQMRLLLERELYLTPMYTTSDSSRTLLQDNQHTSGQGECSGQELSQPSNDVLNILYGGVSPLHVASEHGHSTLVALLLDYGANPTLRDSSGHVPYVVTKEKSVRDCYRRFMGQWPDIYDYTTSQIPSPLTNDMERQRREKAAEKKKDKKRQAKKKKIEEKTKREEGEVARQQGKAVSGLSEREKRALAAEKRLALQQNNDSSIQRAGMCDCCGRGLAGLVPFHRLKYQYCSITCVREHRTQLEQQ